MRLALAFGSLARALLALALFAWTAAPAETTWGYGGECVIYARSEMRAAGFSDAQMPGLCQYSPYDCGAATIWGHWDLGQGMGSQPRPGSLMVFARDASGMPVGHVAIVEQVIANADGTQTLVGSDSNAYGDGLVRRDVHWQFSPGWMMASREGQRWHTVLGFIHSQPAAGPSPAPGMTEAQKADTVLNCAENFGSWYFSPHQSTVQWPQSVGIAYVRGYGPYMQAVWNGDWWYYIGGWQHWGPIEQLRPYCAFTW